MAVWEAAVRQILPYEREGGNSHDPYMYAVTIDKNNDTPIDYHIMMPSDSTKFLRLKLSRIDPKPQTSQKFSPGKDSRYKVFRACIQHVLILWIQ